MNTKTKEQQAIEAAELHVLHQYTDLQRHTIMANWGYDEEELAGLRFTEQGYLIAGIKSSEVVGHVKGDDEAWEIDVIVDIGIDDVEPEHLLVYQSSDGKGDWIVEAR